MRALLSPGATPLAPGRALAVASAALGSAARRAVPKRGQVKRERVPQRRRRGGTGAEPGAGEIRTGTGAIRPMTAK